MKPNCCVLESWKCGCFIHYRLNGWRRRRRKAVVRSALAGSDKYKIQIQKMENAKNIEYKNLNGIGTVCMIFAVNGTTGLNMAGYDIKRFHRKLSTDNDWVIFSLSVIAIAISITVVIIIAIAIAISIHCHCHCHCHDNKPGERANPRKTCQGLLASLPKVIIIRYKSSS